MFPVILNIIWSRQLCVNVLWNFKYFNFQFFWQDRSSNVDPKDTLYEHVKEAEKQRVKEYTLITVMGEYFIFIR